jgi:peptidoglycan-associated lipoprotein
MNSMTLAGLAALAVLAACSSDKDATGSDGMGGAAGIGAGGRGVAGAAIPGSQEDLVASAGDRVFFDTDQSRLNDEARGILTRQAGWMRTNQQVSVWIAGNCDERGTAEYNLALGQRRANAARDYLVAQGVARERMETISFGKDRPIDPGSTAQAWARNRNAITSVK